jgi:SAM-dependent methyltransferase
MDSSTNIFYLCYLRFKTFFKNSLDFFLTVWKFYPNAAFRRADLSLLRSYIGANPYVFSRRFLERSGESNVYAYGETPLNSLQKIVETCELSEDDCIFELGCGRGRTCFWLALVFKAKKVVGIDFVPEFIEKAKAVKTGVEFLCEDFLKSDLTGATVIYLHGSCMKDEDIVKLNKKLIRLKPRLKVITTSFSMAEYDEGNHWEVQKIFTGEFSWGSADVYLQTLK